MDAPTSLPSPFPSPPRPSLPPCQRPPPHSRLILDCSRPPSPVHPPTPSLALTSSPLLLSIRAPPFVPSTLPLSHSISLYLSSPNVFIVAVFSRDSSPFAVCPCIASSLPRALRTKRARARSAPRVALRSPLENVLTTSVLLFLRRSARLLSRARARERSVLPLSTVFSTHSVCSANPFLSLPSLLQQRASFSTGNFPSLRTFRTLRTPFLSLAIPNLVSDLGCFFPPLFFVSSSSSFSFPLFFSSWILFPLHERCSATLYFFQIGIFPITFFIFCKGSYSF